MKEALEASWWLKKAGFPQYVQLFEGKPASWPGGRRRGSESYTCTYTWGRFIPSVGAWELWSILCGYNTCRSVIIATCKELKLV